ncbi:uncharacterized membrane protein YbhN (UPF0104 family) [Afipia massiliensis]|uniref:Uncharacterized membrane protein YbhN (UPF0104 family) n=1 Tax=Afipia massiliensis TaxID=211460 RepID=A0A840MTI7_9BRAD|nr:lysylphosphatidylglycerol synthase domain-containing protein [Afipia massiliensis]MBB5051085.1 uncharacterized membrane protein YbhN (UPF0104 family) [Afipia massiliensis]
MKRIVQIGLSASLLAVALWLAFRGFNPADFKTSLSAIQYPQLALAGFAVIVSSMLAAMRLQLIAAGYGYKLTAREAVATLSLGQIGGLLFFQIFGQLAARSSYLGRRSVPFAGTVLITTQERIAAALVSLALAAAGAIYLFRHLSFDAVAASDLLEAIAGVLIASIAPIIIWKREIASYLSTVTRTDLLRVVQNVGLSLAVQLAMMAAYVSAGRAFGASHSLTDLAAASALVMFAASIPISFAGWGIREMSAVVALGAIGMTDERAVCVALAVGIISIVTAGLLAAVSARTLEKGASHSIVSTTAGKLRPEAFLAGFLPVSVALLMFFQVHVPTTKSVINVNLADPFAIVAGFLLLFSAWRSPPVWRLSYLNFHILACSLAMLVALLIGASRVGWTEWAVTTKFLGWFVLLAFGATGAMGTRIDLSRILTTVTVVGAIIIAAELVGVLVSASGFTKKYFLDGFAQNVNAFSFQCLMVLAASLARDPRNRLVIGLALAAITIAGSRAAIGSAFVVLVTAIIFIPAIWRKVLDATIIACVIVYFIQISGGMASGTMSVLAERSVSDADHYATMYSGFRMFLESPVFGAGLGVFIAEWPATYKLVIHSTPVWLLAEFGIVGAALFLVPIVRIAFGELCRFRRDDVAGNLLLLIIAGFSAMSCFHELFNQRTFWFLLGASLATVTKEKSRTPVKERG